MFNTGMQNFYFVVFCILAFCSCVALPLRAQDEGLSHAPVFWAEANVYQGFVIKHHPRVGHLARSHPSGFSFNFVKNTFGQHYWQYQYGYPDLGLRINHQNYHNPILGASVAAVPYISFFPYKNTRSSLAWSMGLGLAYHTAPHHQTDNNLNIAIGSPVTFALYASLRYQYRLNKNFAAGAFLQLDHFSNGAHTKPNSGINLLQAGLSLSHKISTHESTYQSWQKKILENRRMYLSLLPSISFKELGKGGGEILPSYNLQLSLNKPLNTISSLNLGLDGFYDVAMRQWIAEESFDKEVDFKSVAITFGHELRLANVGFITQVAYHIYQPYTELFGRYYQRYGLKIYMHPRLSVSGNLKTYLGQAEQIEWGLWIRL
ncbi:MAG: acyloxyacyl hydrolase [Cyclobacteriaceae bacterium]